MVEPVETTRVVSPSNRRRVSTRVGVVGFRACVNGLARVGAEPSRRETPVSAGWLSCRNHARDSQPGLGIAGSRRRKLSVVLSLDSGHVEHHHRDHRPGPGSGVAVGGRGVRRGPRPRRGRDPGDGGRGAASAGPGRGPGAAGGDPLGRPAPGHRRHRRGGRPVAVRGPGPPRGRPPAGPRRAAPAARAGGVRGRGVRGHPARRRAGDVGDRRPRLRRPGARAPRPAPRLWAR